MKRKIVKSEFGKNVLTLMTGTTIAQIIPLLITPFLTRLFSPEEFGVLAFFISIITFLSVAGAGRFEQAIVLPKENEDAINVFALAFGILSLYTVLITFIIVVFSTQITEFFGIESLDAWLWLIPVCVFLSVFHRILTFWSNRNKRFKGTSSAFIGLASFRVFTNVAGGVIRYKTEGGSLGFASLFSKLFSRSYVVPKGVTGVGVGSLVLSYGIGYLTGCLMLIFPVLKRDTALFKKVSKSKMKEQAKIYRKFPRINIWHALGDELKNFGVTSTILYGFSDLILGFYSMTFRVLRAPLGVIGNSFGQVFYQKAAEMNSNELDIVPLIKNTTKKLSLIALPIFSLLIFFGPDIFEFVLGDKWRIAGVYAQYLTPWIMLGFIVGPVQQVGVIKNRQEELLLFSILGNIIIFGSILLGAFWFNDILIGFLLLSILQVIYFVSVYLWILSIAKKPVKS